MSSIGVTAEQFFKACESGRGWERCRAVDEARQNVAGYGVFHGTHTGEGGRARPGRS